jgi:hypothetical protein
MILTQAGLGEKPGEKAGEAIRSGKGERGGEALAALTIFRKVTLAA